jgi:tetratricopeptide (TPR) repeat protein
MRQESGGFARQAATIAGIALAIRLCHLWWMRRSPLFALLLGDSRSYDIWARQIASGDLVGRGVFYQAPLYAYFLAAIYAVRPDIDVVRICQAALGTLACVLLGFAARPVFGRQAGLAAGIMLAVYAPAVFSAGLIQKSTLDLVLLCLLLALLTPLIAESKAAASSSRKEGWRWLTAGITIGALALTRENVLLFAPVLTAWIWLADVPHAASRTRQLALLAAGLALVMLPVGVRNRIAGGEFHLTTAQAGPNFFIGNSARADGTYVPLREGRGSPEYEQSDAVDLASRAVGQPLGPGEVSAYWTAQAFDYIRGHPADWLALEARKFRLFWNRTELVDTESQESHEDESPILRWLASVAHFGVLAPLSCAGVLLTWHDRRRLWLLYALIGVYLLSVMAFYVVARYRLPVVPLLIVFAAAAVARSISLAARRTRPISAVEIAGVSCVAAAAIFSNVRAASPDTMRAVTYQNVGAAFLEAGRLDDAAAAFKRAIALSPTYAAAHSSLGSALRLQGNPELAAHEFATALELAPDFDDARLNLANALAATDRAPEAIRLYEAVLSRRPDAVEAQSNLGIALAEAGRLDDAVAHLRVAVHLSDDAKTHFNLGHVLLLRGDLDEAVAELTRATGLAPTDPALRYELGSTYLARQQYDAAIDQFRQAIELSPRSVEARNNLGVALGSAGRLDEAIDAFRGALQVDPQSPDAQANLRAALAVRGGRR